MEKSLHIVLGMTIAYAASLLGLILAWVNYNRRRKAKGEGEDDAGSTDN
jgi:hypothetical protein